MTDQSGNVEEPGTSTEESAEATGLVRWLLSGVLAFPSRVLIAMVRIYQRTLSPMLGPNCRFQPTCSEYMIASIRKKGVIIGTARGVWRIMRCHPFNPGGYDPP